MAATARGAAYYRLRGELAGLVRTFPLEGGSNAVGSAGDCAVLLPARGVSRRHALVHVDGGEVSVEDQGSRNGTFVAGVAVKRAPVACGDEIRFGPVSLRLECLERGDVDLAVELAPAVARSREADGGIETATFDMDAPQPDRSREGLVFPPGYLPGRSPAMASLHAQMKPLVRGNLPVLVLGETGVGKECVARALHLSSTRHAGPFVAVNCAAIPADLLEAEMFGIARAVATGVAERAGKFQLADGGTLLLDEIGELPLPLQAKLLRALQQGEVQPVGGPPVAVDVRVVAATNADLLRRTDDGSFRRDLYYRVAGYALQVPPLRERREDVPGLVESFVRVFVRETGRPVRGITARAMEALVSYAWPGNVRELEHEVRRLVYLCPEGEPIESAMLSPALRSTLAPAAAAEEAPADGLPLEAAIEQLERRLIREALARAGGNRSEAARRLGISRNGLALKMQRLGLGD
jgi:transcriptional regulator with GAF, ATPase, and Fis domain